MSSNETFKCAFCKKEYKRESTLFSHKCQKKERMLAENSRQGRIALEIWIRFREYTQVRYKKKISRWEAFIEAREYQSMMDFAKYIIENKPLNHEEFIDYLIKNSVPIKQWCTHETRRNWIKTVLRREHPQRAIERSILAIQDWADENNEEWTNFFEKISIGRALLWIETGKISPWILHTSGTFKHLMNRLNDQDLLHIYEFIDPSVWNAKMISYRSDVQRIKEVFQEYNF